jgi:hypothetical protein
LENRQRSRLAVIASVLLLAGCGGTDKKVPDPEAASAAVTGFSKAFGAGKADVACGLLTKDAQVAFLRRVQALIRTTDCATALKKVHDEAGADVTQAFETATVTNVHVVGATGLATLTASGHSTTVNLAKQNGAWKLTGVPGI